MLISVDGLDYSGKTACAQILSELTGFEYFKVKKGSLMDYSNCQNETETTKIIIQEISLAVSNKKEIVLDRSYLSALITGKIYDSSLDLDSLLEEIPECLASPKLGIIIVTDHKTALSRIKGNVTPQDQKVLSSNYNRYQQLLISLGKEKDFVVFNNLYQINELRESLEHLLTKHSF